jgi:hypothetical protein
LAEVGVTAFEEVEVVVFEGADDPVAALVGSPEFGLGDAVVDRRLAGEAVRGICLRSPREKVK